MHVHKLLISNEKIRQRYEHFRVISFRACLGTRCLSLILVLSDEDFGKRFFTKCQILTISDLNWFWQNVDSKQDVLTDRFNMKKYTKFTLENEQFSSLLLNTGWENSTLNHQLKWQYCNCSMHVHRSYLSSLNGLHMWTFTPINFLLHTEIVALLLILEMTLDFFWSQ